MRKEYKVTGMSCGHCRKHLEEALNGVAGVKSAVVTLDPPVAVVVFAGEPVALAELQAIVLDEAGDYILSE